MFKLLIAISMVLTVLGVPAADAGSSRAASGQGYSSGLLGAAAQVVDTRGAVIYNITVNGGGVSGLSNGLLTIYDTNQTISDTAAEIVYEVEVATVNDSRSVDMSAAPLQTYNGVVTTCTNCYGFLNMNK